MTATDQLGCLQPCRVRCGLVAVADRAGCDLVQPIRRFPTRLFCFPGKTGFHAGEGLKSCTGLHPHVCFSRVLDIKEVQPPSRVTPPLCLQGGNLSGATASSSGATPVKMHRTHYASSAS
jgi:hypothetical protein